MASDDLVLTEENIVEIIESVEKGFEELKKAFGILFDKGRTKTVSEQEREKLARVNGKLNELKCEIESFQSDVKKVCSMDICQLEVPERRLTTKGENKDRDSGYSSEQRLSAASNYSEKSSNRILKVDSSDLDRISSDEAELYNPSRSGSDSSFSDDREDNFKKPQFYIRESDTSPTDLSVTITDHKTYDDETIPKVLVESTDKEKQSYTYPDIVQGRYEKTSYESIAQTLVEEENSYTTESHSAQIQNEGKNDNTVPKKIEYGHSDSATTAINNLSKRSSEEDNTKYAAAEPEK